MIANTHSDPRFQPRRRPALALGVAVLAACGGSPPAGDNPAGATTRPNAEPATRDTTPSNSPPQVADTTKLVGTLPRIVWKVELDDAKDDYHLQAATLTSDGTQLQVTASVRARNGTGAARSLLWVATDAKGAIVARRDVASMLPAAERAQMNLSGPSAGRELVAAGGETWLLLATDSGAYRLLRTTTDPSAQKVTLPIALTGSTPTIETVQSSPDGNIALLGHVDGKPFFAKIDRTGNVLGNTPAMPGDKTGAVVAALFEAGSGATLVAATGEPPATQLLREAGKGAMVAGASLAGRPLAAVLGKGGYAVVTETGGPPQSAVTLTAFAASGLEQRWSRVLASGHVGGFQIVAIPAGGYVVAGVVDRGLWVSRLDELGQVQWTHARKPQETAEREMVARLELDASGDECVVTYSAFIVVGREQREVVRSLRFSGAS